MTWGSNATFDTVACRYCGGNMIDDRDEGESTHEQGCSRRPLWRGVLGLFRRAPPTPPSRGNWVNSRGEIVDGCAPTAESFDTSVTATCPLCGAHDAKRPFIRHAISCSREDCFDIAKQGTDNFTGESAIPWRG